MKPKDLAAIVVIWIVLAAFLGGGCGASIVYLGFTEIEQNLSGDLHRTYDMEKMRTMTGMEIAVRFIIGFVIGGGVATLIVWKSSKSIMKPKRNYL